DLAVSVGKAARLCRRRPVAYTGGNPTDTGLGRVEQVGEEKAAAVTIGGESRREIREPGAAYVKVHFAALSLGLGGYVTVAGPSGSCRSSRTPRAARGAWWGTRPATRSTWATGATPRRAAPAHRSWPARRTR